MGCSTSKNFTAQPVTQFPPNQKNSIKISFLGKSGVGKSSITLRYCRNLFLDSSEATIGASFLSKHLSYNNKSLKLEIWDTAGQERYKALAPMYYRGSDVVCLVYDITSRESFLALEDWMNLVKKDLPNKPVIVVGNKSDLESERTVPMWEAVEYSTAKDCLYLETSSKTPYNIDMLFSSAIKLVMKL